jgi:hypothetical protein
VLKPQNAAMAAGAPENPGRQAVASKSYFRQAMKAALHSTVAVVCAGSMAVNAVANPPAPQPPPPPVYEQNEIQPRHDDRPNPPNPNTGQRYPGNGIADGLHSGLPYRHQITLDYPPVCPGASTSSDPTYMTCPVDQTFPDTGLYSELRKAAIEGNLGILKKILDDAREEGRRETIDINNPPDTPWLLSQANVQDVVTQFLKEVWRGGLFLVLFNAQRPLSSATATRWGEADGLLAPYAVGIIGTVVIGYVYHAVFAKLGCRLIKPEPQSHGGEFCESQVC